MHLREKLPTWRDLLRYALGSTMLALLLALLHGMTYYGEDVFVLSTALPALRQSLSFGLAAIRAPWVALVLFLLALCCHFAKRRGESIPQFLFRARYPLALLLWVVMTLLEISGSSVYMWHNYLPESDAMQGPLYGIARSIRSDEWAMGTPTAREAFTHGLSNSAYMQAVEQSAGWNPLLAFQPIEWTGWMGYSMSRACFNSFQLIGLALVTIELLLILTGGQKRLAALGAALVVLSPFAQWWSATGFLLYGQLAVVTFYYYLHTEVFWKRTLLLLGLWWSLGCFSFILYPGWMIPMTYVFGIVALFLLWRARKTVRMRPRDWVSIVVAALLLLGLAAFFFYHARGAVQTVAGSVYPGQRVEVGGQKGSYFFSYFSGPFLPYRTLNLVKNQSENGLFYCFYPAGFLLALWVILRQRKRDGLLIALLLLDVCAYFFAAVGFPEPLAKVTLLFASSGLRVGQFSGYPHLLVLLRAASLLDAPVPRRWALPASLGTAAVALYMGTRFEQDYFTPVMLALSFGAIAFGAYGFARYPVPRCRQALSGFIVVLSLMCGVTVNPLQRGMANVEQVPLYRAIAQAEEEAPGLWVIEADFPLTNFPMMTGAETLNATQRYPNLERWGMLDESGEDFEVYNRYAHIGVKLVEEPPAEHFELMSTDQFRVTLSPEELVLLGVDYVVTRQDLSGWGSGAAAFEEIGEAAPYGVYRVITE